MTGLDKWVEAVLKDMLIQSDKRELERLTKKLGLKVVADATG